MAGEVDHGEEPAILTCGDQFVHLPYELCGEKVRTGGGPVSYSHRAWQPCRPTRPRPTVTVIRGPAPPALPRQDRKLQWQLGGGAAGVAAGTPGEVSLLLKATPLPTAGTRLAIPRSTGSSTRGARGASRDMEWPTAACDSLI